MVIINCSSIDNIRIYRYTWEYIKICKKARILRYLVSFSVSSSVIFLCESSFCQEAAMPNVRPFSDANKVSITYQNSKVNLDTVKS